MKNTSIFLLMGFSISLSFVQGQTVRDPSAFSPKPGSTISGLLPEHLPGTIVIKFKAGTYISPVEQGPVITGFASFDQKAASVEATCLVKRFRHQPVPEGSGIPDISRIFRLTFPEKYDPLEVAEIFRDDPMVEYAEPEPRMKILDVPDDPLYPQQQHLPQIMAEEAWNIHKGENGTQAVKIAIIDTGVDWEHEDLTSNTWENLGEDADGDGHTLQMSVSGPVLDPGDLNGIDNDGNGFTDDLIGWDFYEEYISGNGSNPDPNPVCSMAFHGTHCAGIATAVTGNNTGVSGIGWNLKYMAVQSDWDNSISWGWDGIIYAADMEADVISCSWGGYYWAYYQFGADVVAYARAKGSIVVCAAGNENIDGYHMPSSYPGAISVASVNEDDTKAPYSSFCAAVDVSAPGGGRDGGILSTLPDNSYGTEMGTSMATPLVAGLMGLVKSYHPDWTGDQVVDQVIASCDDIDPLNPLFVNKMGNGRINAYQALAMTNVSPPQELKLDLLDFTVSDQDNNGQLEPGESGTVSIRLRNFTHGVSSGSVTFSFSTSDTLVQINGNNLVGTIDSDSMFLFNNVLQFTVVPGAVSHTSVFKLNISADIPIVVGNEFDIPVVLAPSGFFVYEKAKGELDYSGTYIRNYLERRGFNVTYSNYFPQSLKGFECVFLSLGNLVEPLWDPGTFLTENMHRVIGEYLKTGGRMYMEGGSVFYMAQECNSGYLAMLKNLFGIANAPVAMKNPINKLSGISGTAFESIEFTSSSQYNNNYIEKIFPFTSATCVLEESSHGKVAIFNTGTVYNQKTFYFTYSLADLKDTGTTNSRFYLLNKIMELLGYPLQPGYLISNFTAEKFSGGVGEEIMFSDISLAPPGVNIVGWQWDFQNDGIIDSYEKNPVYVYNEAGSFDVRLICSNGGNSDEYLVEDFFTVNRGMFVYEGIEGCRDMSGTWMKDFLEQHFYQVTYSIEVPRSLSGYDAAFISLGTPMSFSVSLDDGFVRIIRDYLEEGGKVYLEEGFNLTLNQYNPEVWALFGIADVTNPFATFTTIPFDTIVGGAGSICEGFVFGQTNQLGQFFIDQFIPNQDGIVAFEEPGYGNVAIQHSGSHGEKTFCFSWSLAELQDAGTTREDLMWAIMNYFGLITGQEELIPMHSPGPEVFPNPFTQSVNFAYQLTSTETVCLRIYNSLGETVALFPEGVRAPGVHYLTWNAGECPAGLYYYRLDLGDNRFTGKMLMIQ